MLKLASYLERNRLLASDVESFPTPYGFKGVALTSLLVMPGCIIEMLETVSKTIILVTPSISTVMEGVPFSNRTATKGAMTAFSEVLRRRELSSLTPRSRFPDFSFLYENSVLSLEGYERLERSVGFPFSGE